MGFKQTIKNAINKVENIMFPHFVCPICERETPDGKLCENCLKSFYEEAEKNIGKENKIARRKSNKKG